MPETTRPHFDPVAAPDAPRRATAEAETKPDAAAEADAERTRTDEPAFTNDPAFPDIDSDDE